MSILPLEDLATSVIGVINKFIPDTAAKDAAKAEVTTLIITASSQIDAAQSNIDAVEAANNNLFVSGWRPFIGWSCGIAWAGHYILEPAFFFLKSCVISCAVQPYDVTEINNVLYLLLGFGAMRTVDKSVALIGKVLK